MFFLNHVSVQQNEWVVRAYTALDISNYNGVTSYNDHVFWMYLLSFLSKRHNIRGCQIWWASGPRRILPTAAGLMWGCSGYKSPDEASSKAAHVFPSRQTHTINVYMYAYIYIHTQPSTQISTDRIVPLPVSIKGTRLSQAGIVQMAWSFFFLADQNQVHHQNRQTHTYIACLSISWLWTLGLVSSWLPDPGAPPAADTRSAWG